MDMPNHIPIHPRFAPKVFMQNPSPQQQQFSHPAPQQESPSSNQLGGGVEEDYDIFEVPSIDKGQEEQKKKPYDKLIIVMAIVIIVLIAVIIWLMLSNNDEIDDRRINPAQFMGYPPPNARGPPQFMQMPQPSQYPQFQQANPAVGTALPTDTSKQEQSAAPKAYKSEMDTLYNELKQKSANNEKLPLDKLVKAEESKPRTLDTIFEETNSDEDIEEYTTDPDDVLTKS